jgi:hypothetical protein
VTFPFPNPKPLGWAMFEALSSVAMTQINQNAANAADGAMWSDVALSNILATNVMGTLGQILGWDSFSRHFYSIGSSGSTPGASRSRTGRIWFSLSVPGQLTITGGNRRHAFASNGAGTIMFGGSQPSGVSSYRRSADGGATWAAVSTSSTANQHVRCMRWVSFLGRFISGFENGAIETSPTGETWTNQTVPDAQDRTSGIADNGSIVVMGNAGTPQFVTSSNGTAWTLRTGAGAASSVAWSPYWGKFFAYGPTVMQSSADGITWSSAGLTLPTAITSFGTIPLGVFGRVLWMLGHDSSAVVSLCYSIDGGASWQVADTPSSLQALSLVVAPHGGMVFTDNALSCVHFATIRGGG